MDALLTAEHEALLEAERNLLARLHGVLARTGADESLRERLSEVIEALDALFVVVVVGEFNAGKSTVLNALFGEKLLEEGPIPTTAKITLLRHGETPMERPRSEYLVERYHPSERLRHLVLVDTPGTNSIIRRHQELTEHFIPRADLVLFVTSFDRPLAESERQFLSYIRDTWGKRLVFVLNKADLAQSETDLEQVLAHIRTGCQELMGFEPEIFPISAARAFKARTTDDPAQRDQCWKTSGFDAFEQFLVKRLAGPERLRLKLTAPLDVTERLLERLRAHLTERRRLLEQDRANLERLEARLQEVRAELIATVRPYLSEIDNQLLQVERRGLQFLRDTIRIGRLGLLRDRDRFKEEFARQVVRDLDHQLEAILAEAVDRLLQQGLQLWNQTLNEFTERVEQVVRRRSPQVQAELLYDRRQLFEAVVRQATRQLETYDLREEARRILENTRDAVALFLGTEALAGLGALVTMLITAAGLDVTGGLVAAGALAVVGFVVLPLQKRRALREFCDRLEQLRTELRTALEQQLTREVDRLLERLSATLAPYQKFVHREQQLVGEIEEELQALEREYRRLRTAIEKAVPVG
ncbi:dynamin family protein [Rhodothermus profundi]|uniref:Small GTP-binding protein domain-containing protein n=1 Tax=Rhodothermus profundi TaxID=633813 RepID=A0A1M6VW33_9BACT|nr:dynamin family protein [Rhodothermus profundi]SHK85639.1 small GTP-binding protein domain-containing protein [Rhodothermus profundi]